MSGSRLENGKEIKNFLEIYIWKNNDLYCKDAKHLVKLSPAITWKIKIVSHQIVDFGNVVSKQI